jgi:hypothetical protein
VHCDFCGADFPEAAAAKSACATCLVGKAKGIDACGFRKCPRCGYEIPVEPAWIAVTRRFVAGLFRRDRKRLGA